MEFSSEVLLKKDFRAFFGISHEKSHRQGAALALFLMPNEWGQNNILNKASHSAFRDLRRAYQDAKSKSNWR
jgi:hypothetical protein